MTLSSTLAALVERFGERGLIQEAKAINPAVKTLEDISPDVINKIVMPKAGTRATMPPAEPSADEVAKFGESVNKGSDIATDYRESLKDTISGVPEQTLPENAGIVRTSPTEPYPGSGQDLSNIKYQSGEATPSDAEVFPDMSSANQSPKGLSTAIKTGLGAGAVLGGASYLSSMSPEVATGVTTPKSLAAKVSAAKAPQAADTPPAAPATPAKLVDQLKAPGPLRLDKEQFSDPDYAKAVEAFKDAQAKATSEYADAKTRTDWGRVASLLGEGLVKYGAARQGLNSNVDLSHIDIKAPDWHQMLEEDKDKYTQATEGAYKNAALEKGLSDEKRKAFDQAQANLNVERTKNFEVQHGDYSQAKKFAEEEKVKKMEEEAAQKRAETMVAGKVAVQQMKPNSVQAKQEAMKDTNFAKAVGSLNALAAKPDDPKFLRDFEAAATAAGIPEDAIAEAKAKAKTPAWKNLFTNDRDAATTLLFAHRPQAQQAPTTQAGASGASPGMITVLHKPTGQTKTYQANDPKLQAVLLNPDFVRQ